MASRLRSAAFLVLGMLPGCAALTEWNGYLAAAASDDGRAPEPPTKTEKKDADPETTDDVVADSGPPAAPIAVLQTVSAGIDQDLATVTATLAKPTTAGSTILVAVGWYSVTIDIETMADTLGGKYELAGNPTKFSGANEKITQKIFFARGMPAGTYSLTVTFPQAVDTPDIRVAEVKGLDPNAPFLAAAENKGHVKALAAGPLHFPGPGIVFAAATIEDEFTSCAAGFETCLINPSVRNMAEAKVIAAAGDVTVTHVLAADGDSVLQAAGFH